MQLHLDILPKAQRKLWPFLSNIPKEFILYGGTAIALQLGHRKSVDRAECKDYIDIDALIQSGIPLEQGLSYAKKIYGNVFDPATSLRALCSYRDGDLDELDSKIVKRLSNAAKQVNNIP